MMHLGNSALHVITPPLVFLLRTLRGFQKNQGLLLAGAIAYYALLSTVPFLILTVLALSYLVERAELLDTLQRYLEWLVPSQSSALLMDLTHFLENGAVIGVVLLVTMLFFSTLTFSVLEKSMAVIFSHRVIVGERHFLTAALLPYCLVFLLGAGLLVVTLVSVALEALALMSVDFLLWHWSLSGLSRALLYLLGVSTETLVFFAIYFFTPVGKTAPLHAAIVGFLVAATWEIVRHQLIWYFATMSKASVVYGSLTTAVVTLFSMEIIATLLLLGAQCISEYERLDPGNPGIS